MLKKDTLDFLVALQDNNNREWFTENKKWYERARADFETLVGQLIQSIAMFDSEVGLLNPKKCMFRIYRDTRFAADKTPYKTNFGAVFRPHTAGRLSGYYLHLSPEEIFISYGQYMLMPDQLKKMRRGIYNDFEMFEEIINEKRFKKEIGDLYRDEDMLQRVPNGFDKNHPAAEYLKLKHFYALKPVSQEQLFSEDFVGFATGMYKIMQPLGRFLDDVLEEDI